MEGGVRSRSAGDQPPTRRDRQSPACENPPWRDFPGRRLVAELSVYVTIEYQSHGLHGVLP